MNNAADKRGSDTPSVCAEQYSSSRSSLQFAQVKNHCINQNWSDDSADEQAVMLNRINHHEVVDAVASVNRDGVGYANVVESLPEPIPFCFYRHALNYLSK